MQMYFTEPRINSVSWLDVCMVCAHLVYFRWPSHIKHFLHCFKWVAHKLLWLPAMDYRKHTILHTRILIYTPPYSLHIYRKGEAKSSMKSTFTVKDSVFHAGPITVLPMIPIWPTLMFRIYVYDGKPDYDDLSNKNCNIHMIIIISHIPWTALLYR